MKNYFKLMLYAAVCAVCFSSCCTLDAILDPCCHPVYVAPAPPPPPPRHHRYRPRPLPPPPPPPPGRHHRHWSSVDGVKENNSGYYEMAAVEVRQSDALI